MKDWHKLKPELFKKQPYYLPGCDTYAIYRQFLLETSQIPGGFYSAKGRSELLRNVGDRMLRSEGPYPQRLDPSETTAQHLRLVR
jgi:capsular polysaccharide export protein